MSELVKAGEERLKMLQDALHSQPGSHVSLDTYEDSDDSALADAVGLLTIGQGGTTKYHGATASSEVNGFFP